MKHIIWHYKGQRYTFDPRESARKSERCRFCGHCGTIMGYESHQDDQDYMIIDQYYCVNADCRAFNFYQRPLRWDEIPAKHYEEPIQETL